MAILVFTVPIPAFPVPPHVLPSTKLGFLCAFCLRDPHYRAFQAQKSTFCTILPSRTPDFRLFEHKIEVFVLFLPSRPPFSGFPSTKSAFLCALVGRRPGATGATTWSNGSNWSKESNGSNGATGTTAGIVWVADILSQRGVV